MARVKAESMTLEPAKSDKTTDSWVGVNSIVVELVDPAVEDEVNAERVVSVKFTQLFLVSERTSDEL